MARINAVEDLVFEVEAVSKYSDPTAVPGSYNTGDAVLNTDSWLRNTGKRPNPQQGGLPCNQPTKTPPKGDYRRYKPNYNNKTNTYNLGQVWLTDTFNFASFDEGFSGRLSEGCGGWSKSFGTRFKNAKSDARVLIPVYFYSQDLPEVLLSKHS